MKRTVRPGRAFPAAALALAMALPAFSLASPSAQSCSNPLTDAIPARLADAAPGSRVMGEASALSGTERDAVLAGHLLAGNLPSYLRRLKPVSIDDTLADGRRVRITLCVTPGYLAVGDDADFVRVPMGLAAAARVADGFGFLLPTTRMVDAIHDQAAVRLRPSPMKPTDRMTSTDYLMRHNRTVEDQRARAGRSPADLTAGQKKDVVLSKRLLAKPGRVAIYGWHRTNGVPIQPLSTVHGAGYSDYSHGVRLVSGIAYLNGEPRALADMMRDDTLVALLSDDGPMDDVRGFQASLFR